MRLFTGLAARARRPSTLKVVRHVLLILGVLTSVYLISANLLLRTQYMRDQVSSGPDSELSYESAYSLWPGRAHFSGLLLTAQDYNVQFSVSVTSGVVDVSLHELLLKRFHAESLDVQGLSFRLRHKVAAVTDDNRARVATYPPIEGYADPPVYPGPKPPSDPNAADKVWKIAIEGIEAELAELWMQEFRYLGEGSVTGGFRLTPGQNFEVYSSRVTLDGGPITLGDKVVTDSLSLTVDGRVDATETADASGRGMFKAVSGTLDVKLAGDLSTIDLYLGPAPKVNVMGRAEIDGLLSVAAGHVEPSTRTSVAVRDASVSSPRGRAVGDVSLQFGVLPAGPMELVLSSARLALENHSGHKDPVLEGLNLNVQVDAADLSRPPELRRAHFELPKVNVPSLGWFNPLLGHSDPPMQLEGRLDGDAAVDLQTPAGLTARVRLRLVGGSLQRDDFRVALAGHLNAEIDPESPENVASVGRVDVELDGVELGQARERNKSFRAAVRVSGLKIERHPEPRVSGAVLVQAAPSDALLSLVLGSPVLEELAAGVLDLERFEANAKFSISQSSTKLELSRAQSGGLKGKGFWQRPPQGEPRGAFLVTSDVANVGLSLRGSETETDLFVPDDWLSLTKGAGARRSLSKARKAKAKRPTPRARPE